MTLKFSPENQIIDAPDLNRFRIGDHVIADECEDCDRHEGVVVGIEICDAVLQWIVKHHLGQADDEFTAADVTSVLDNLWGDEEDQPGDPTAAEEILRKLAAAPASAAEPVKVKFGDMPSYGRATGNNLLAAVHAAIYGRGEVKFAEINDDHPLWHQMVPTINFDSLNRIVTAFVNGSKVT